MATQNSNLDKFILNFIAYPEMPCGAAILLLIILTLLEGYFRGRGF